MMMMMIHRAHNVGINWNLHATIALILGSVACFGVGGNYRKPRPRSAGRLVVVVTESRIIIPSFEIGSLCVCASVFRVPLSFVETSGRRNNSPLSTCINYYVVIWWDKTTNIYTGCFNLYIEVPSAFLWSGDGVLQFSRRPFLKPLSGQVWYYYR